jgi:hypothetical protein
MYKGRIDGLGSGFGHALESISMVIELVKVWMSLYPLVN